MSRSPLIFAALQGTCLGQQLVNEGGLAMVNVGNNCDVTQFFMCICHRGRGLWMALDGW